jgi:hypothetical protein
VMHLGMRITQLVDGQLAADVADRANAHLAGCDDCRREAEQERLIKNRLASLAGPAPESDFLAQLVHLADSSKPRSGEELDLLRRARPGTLSAGAGGRPMGVGDDLIRASNRGSTRPRGRSAASGPGWPGPTRFPAGAPRRGLAAAMVGAVCVVGATGVLLAGGRIPGQRNLVPALDSFVIQHLFTTDRLPPQAPGDSSKAHK